MDATRARFLTEIVSRLGADRIVELHLFSPIRQGSAETGVAVVAVTQDDGAGTGDGAEAEYGAGAEAQGCAGEGVDDAVAPEAADAEPLVAEPVLETVPETVLASVPESVAAVPPLSAVPPDRLVVYTARYRLTRKGPDRGKWLVEMAATADAPLATVDMVARGVTQRSKDLTESERFSGDQLRALLEEPQWRTPT
jgi:hypothetical protein